MDDLKKKHCSEAEIDAALGELDGWERDGHLITKAYDFKNFIEAFSYMSLIALYCEKLDHHPFWRINYNKVWIRLTSNSEGRLTQLDFKLARVMEKQYQDLWKSNE